ncbi:hypothetical protein CQ010_01475 [Arthrobacter sp. MYb211]|uniref:hypothetical protein n=1 Tax=unclassified Arthrobacter TaxID=235627 RepID=UPI000CFCDE95|nr:MULTISPECIES: hypothetical protein [unclassified Arthrobacter]PRA13345.1 hypothetical protein CQ015_03730 [Arthrobacter sp. MYb221]PRC10542.1 hypothetical protein CQ010_01475 [Arthrobacter sp. MYb211]
MLEEEALAKLVAMDDSIDPATSALQRLKQLRAVRTLLDEEPKAIARARLAGVSWAQIGEVTGYSRATVIKKAKEGNAGELPDMPRADAQSSSD